MSNKTFEATFVGLDLSEFYPDTCPDATENHDDTKANVVPRISASKELCSILAQEMDKKIADTLENQQISRNAMEHAQSRLKQIIKIRQDQEEQERLPVTPLMSWFEQCHKNVDSGGLYSTLISMHQGDDHGARKVIPRHRSSSSSISNVYRKKKINVKTKIMR